MSTLTTYGTGPYTTQVPSPDPSGDGGDAIAQDIKVLTDASNALAAGKADASTLTAHTNNTSNPHAVTKAQVGLGNVPNVDATNASNITTGTLDVARLPTAIPATSIGTGITTNTELGYVHGVTSAIQTQLNNLNSAVTGAQGTATNAASAAASKVAMTNGTATNLTATANSLTVNDQNNGVQVNPSLVSLNNGHIAGLDFDIYIAKFGNFGTNSAPEGEDPVISYAGAGSMYVSGYKLHVTGPYGDIPISGSFEGTLTGDLEGTVNGGTLGGMAYQNADMVTVSGLTFDGTGGSALTVNGDAGNGYTVLGVYDVGASNYTFSVTDSGIVNTKKFVSTETVGGSSNPAFIFDTNGDHWGFLQNVFSFRKNGTEYVSIDGTGSLIASNGSIRASSLTPESGGGGFLGHGMRRASTAAGFHFAYGEALTTGECGMMIFPIGGTHDTTKDYLQVWTSSSKTTKALQLDGNANLRIKGNLGVGNSATGTTLGSVVKKVEIFDASGTSLGFIPVYNSIT